MRRMMLCLVVTVTSLTACASTRPPNDHPLSYKPKLDRYLPASWETTSELAGAPGFFRSASPVIQDGITVAEGDWKNSIPAGSLRLTIFPPRWQAPNSENWQNVAMLQAAGYLLIEFKNGEREQRQIRDYELVCEESGQVTLLIDHLHSYRLKIGANPEELVLEPTEEGVVAGDPILSLRVQSRLPAHGHFGLSRFNGEMDGVARIKADPSR